MVFNSVVFAVFLVIALTLCWVSPSRWRNGILPVASYVFYGYWDWRSSGGTPQPFIYFQF